jgi:FkbM family methyltransferase
MVGDSIEIQLPPEHMLPTYQAKYPNYDRYFLKLFTYFEAHGYQLEVVDVGANVGDTAAAILSSAPKARIICVEGAANFLPFLHRNLSPFKNVEIVEAFVAVSNESVRFTHAGGTGRLEPVAVSTDADSTLSFVTVKALLDRLSSDKLAIWKSDTDGYDIALLADNFDIISASCSVIWIEYDPVGILTEPDDIRRLSALISEMDCNVVLFDNFGLPFLRVPSKESETLLEQINQWLKQQTITEHRCVHYLDMWLLSDQFADVICGITPSGGTVRSSM